MFRIMNSASSLRFVRHCQKKTDKKMGCYIMSRMRLFAQPAAIVQFQCAVKGRDCSIVMSPQILIFDGWRRWGRGRGRGDSLAARRGFHGRLR